MAHQAIEKGTGARGLRSILEKSMLELMFDLPSRTDVQEVIIDKDFIANKGEAKLELKKVKKKKSS